MATTLLARIATAAVLLPALLAGGCSAPAPQTREVTANGPESSPAAPVPEKTVTAREAMASISGKVPTAKLVKVYSEDDDPNKLLGRPNGYTSKVAFSDSRISKRDIAGTGSDAIERGGSIEVYPDEQGALDRAKYIQGMLKSTGFGTEYDYVRIGVLVRVTGNLTPSKAKEYKAALG